MSKLPPHFKSLDDWLSPDEDKRDYRADPDDVTGLCEADPELAKQLQESGFVVRWAIDGRWRLTEHGKRIRAMRLDALREARDQNLIQPFENPELDAKARQENS